MTRIPLPLVEDVVHEALCAAGMDAAGARTCARVHAASSADGVASHGLNRVPRFVDYLRRGWVDPRATPVLVQRMGAIEVHDGRDGPGVLNALHAVDRAMDLAAASGVGVVALRGTTHWMRGGTYGWRAAERGCAAVCWTNTESCMPPWGAKSVRVGNNPFVVAVPRPEGPLVLDMAMSQYSYGKLQATRLAGLRLPFPGGFDAGGRLTDDPAPIEASMRILPAGYWKGSGLAIVLDALAAMLAGGLATPGIDRVGRGSCGGCSQVFVAFSPAALGGEAAARLADAVVAHVKGAVCAEGAAEVRYPGEAQLRTRAQSLARGVVVDDGVWAEVLRLAGRGG